MMLKRWLVPGLALCALVASVSIAPPVIAQDAATIEALRRDLLEPVLLIIEEAESLGAKRRCPRTYTDVDNALTAINARIAADPDGARGGALAADIASLDLAARHLRSRAAFIQDMRNEKHDWEAAAIRYDRLVESLAAVSDINISAGWSGPEAGRALVDSVSARRIETRALIDSLALSNREMNAWVRVEKDANETLLNSLHAEITELRHALWEMQLRAGVAEADRSAVEADITVAETRIDKAEAVIRENQRRAEQLKGLADLFSAEEGEVLLTPEGAVRINLKGFKFASGSAWLNPRYFGLLDKVVTVADLFPGAALMVEGHTDASGARSRNITLSKERATRIADVLAQKMHVQAESIEAVGVGPDRPVAPNTTDAGKARNRRIEIVITPVPDSP